MPYRCCVPYCNGNYPSGPKVSIFSFPNDKNVVQKWLQMIQRKDFYPRKHSRVCELHFQKTDFETMAYGHDDKTGNVISVPLKVRRLNEKAVPSIFPTSPPCSSSKGQCPRKWPKDKRTKKKIIDLESDCETVADGHKDKSGKVKSTPVKKKLKLKAVLSTVLNSPTCNLSEGPCSKKCPGGKRTKKKKKMTTDGPDNKAEGCNVKTIKMKSAQVKIKILEEKAIQSVFPNSSSSCSVPEGQCSKKCPEYKNIKRKKVTNLERDFETLAGGHDVETRELISTPVKIKRLKEKAISSIFPNSSPCKLSEKQCSRVGPDNIGTENEKNVTDSDSEFETLADGQDEMADGQDDMADGHDDKTENVISTPVKIKRLKEKAVPSVSPNSLPDNLSKEQYSIKFTEDSVSKSKKKMTDLEKGISASISAFEKYNESRKVNNLSDIKKCIEDFGISKFWTYYDDDNSNSLFLLHIESDPEPFIQYSVKINCNLDLSVSAEKSPVGKLMNYSFPINIQHFDDLVNILDLIENNLKQKDGHYPVKSVIDLIVNLLESIKTDENEKVITFIQEQVGLLLLCSNHFRYSTDFLIFSCTLKSISSHAYNFIRQSENITLPHPDTLRTLCSNVEVSPQLELHDENFLMYIASRVNFLREHEKTVILLIDEIHLKPYYDYEGKTIIGAAFDINKAATSAFVFMVSSIVSAFKEVIYILPVNSINFQMLHDVTKKVIVGLENLDLKVICVLTDNNYINDRAMSLFAEPSQESFVYPHPVDQSRPLFFLIDSVYNLKNIRNDWLNQKNPDTCFFYPDFDNPKISHFKTASFTALKKIHEIQSDGIISYAKELTLNSIAPTNLERQNVKLVFSIFNKFVIQALLTLGPKHNVAYFEDTAMFIDIICKWWYIFNVKTPNKGIDEISVFMEPLNGDECDEKCIFLNKFLIWLDAWENMNCDSGALSKETHKALVQTTHGMLELVQYCVDECKMKYILTGKIQTDSLEARYGRHRQMGGSHYHISVKQLLECKRKLRLKSCVKLELRLNSTIVPLTHFDDESCDDISVKDNDDSFKDLPSVSIDEAKIENVKAFLPVVTYLGGFCSHTIIKKLKCDYCKENLILNLDINLDESYNLIKNLDDGGLKCPTQFVVTVVMFNYIVVNSLYSDIKCFKKISNQRQVAVKVTCNMLKNWEVFLDHECPNSHSGDYICKLLLCVSTNIILKNICIKETDKLMKKKEERKNSKKRKLEAFQK